MELFDFIKLLFTKNDTVWNELTDHEKSKHFFMCNRFMSIKFPIQANSLQHYRVYTPAVIDYWRKTMSKLHSSQPGWIFAKTKKKEKEEKKLELPSKEMQLWYCSKNEMSLREFEDSVKFFGQSFIKEIKDLEKILKAQGVIKG